MQFSFIICVIRLMAFTLAHAILLVDNSQLSLNVTVHPISSSTNRPETGIKHSIGVMMFARTLCKSVITIKLDYKYSSEPNNTVHT